MVPAPHLWESSEDHEDDQQSSDPRDNLTKERMKRAPSFLNISMSEKFDTLATTLVSTSHARQASCVSSRPGRCCAKQALSMVKGDCCLAFSSCIRASTYSFTTPHGVGRRL